MNEIICTNCTKYNTTVLANAERLTTTPTACASMCSGYKTAGIATDLTDGFCAFTEV